MNVVVPNVAQGVSRMRELTMYVQKTHNAQAGPDFADVGSQGNCEQSFLPIVTKPGLPVVVIVGSPPLELDPNMNDNSPTILAQRLNGSTPAVHNCMINVKTDTSMDENGSDETKLN